MLSHCLGLMLFANRSTGPSHVGLPYQNTAKVFFVQQDRFYPNGYILFLYVGWQIVAIIQPIVRYFGYKMTNYSTDNS